MSDVFTKAKRSAVMAQIRGRGNKTTEGRMAALLRGAGLTGWRRHHRLLGGSIRPDFVFLRERVCLFVDGCFWHKCPRCYREPVANAAFWKRKIEGNQRRDRCNSTDLRRAGFMVLRIWECRLKNSRSAAAALERVRRRLSASAVREMPVAAGRSGILLATTLGRPRTSHRK